MVELNQGALEVVGPFQEVLVAWASETLLDACLQGENVGEHHLVPQLEASPLWALLAALIQEEGQVGKKEAYLA